MNRLSSDIDWLRGEGANSKESKAAGTEETRKQLLDAESQLLALQAELDEERQSKQQRLLQAREEQERSVRAIEEEQRQRFDEAVKEAETSAERRFEAEERRLHSRVEELEERLQEAEGQVRSAVQDREAIKAKLEEAQSTLSVYEVCACSPYLSPLILLSFLLHRNNFSLCKRVLRRLTRESGVCMPA